MSRRQNEYGLAKLRVRKLVKSLKALDKREFEQNALAKEYKSPPRENLLAFKRESEMRCNEAEMRFVHKAFSKALRDGLKIQVLRNGWPDFLVIEDGRGYAVEVKQPTDSVRPNQATMFEVLESLGILVYVWCPKNPNTLKPWRKWTPEGKAESRKVQKLEIRKLIESSDGSRE